MRNSASIFLCLTLLLPTSSFAQDTYPSRPVHIIVPGAAGGGFDVLARIIAERLKNKWGEPVVVEDRGGGGGNIGANFVLKSDPDGYTILLGNDTELINPSLYRVPPFDYHDFTPISRLVFAPNILVANPSAHLDSFQDFVNAAKKQPGKINVASPGNGSPGHLSLELIEQLAGIKVNHVPYRGAGPAVVDVVEGQVPVGIAGIPPTMGHIRSGRLVSLAVTSAERMQALPSVPTLREVGLTKFSVNAWMGFLGPAHMPAAVVRKIETDSIAVMNDPEIENKLITLGFQPAPISASGLAEMMQQDYPVWRAVITRLGIKLD